MRLFVFLIVFLFYSAQGFAQSKFEECERALAAYPRTVVVGGRQIDLKEDQILVTGVLTHKQSQNGRIKHSGWSLTVF